MPFISHTNSNPTEISCVASFCGVVLAYYVYEDGRVLEELKRETYKKKGKLDNQLQSQTPLDSAEFSIVRVKVKGGKSKYGKIKTNQGFTKKGMIVEIISEAQELGENDFLLIRSRSDFAVDAVEGLKERVGERYIISYSPNGEESIIKMERKHSQ